MKPVASALFEPFPSISQAPLCAGREIPLTPAKGFPLRVLVVDDEPLIRWSVAESLADFGVDVAQAGDAASALRAVTTAPEPFHVVVLDLRLPDMRDLSLLATLRQLLPRARLILMTAYGSPDVLAEASLLEAAVLNKPFELESLQRLVIGENAGGVAK